MTNIIAAPDRTICQHTGKPAQRPSKFWEANRAADERIAELDRLRAENAALRARVAELEKPPSETRFVSPYGHADGCWCPDCEFFPQHTKPQN